MFSLHFIFNLSWQETKERGLLPAARPLCFFHDANCSTTESSPFFPPLHFTCMHCFFFLCFFFSLRHLPEQSYQLEILLQQPSTLPSRLSSHTTTAAAATCSAAASPLLPLRLWLASSGFIFVEGIKLSVDFCTELPAVSLEIQL